ncbi:MAG: hypothetical protein HY903_21615 [Deltaproteobacteria bacterium]|nr:hypothetical protein [Deltaproteobacteria bacterium]
MASACNTDLGLRHLVLTGALVIAAGAVGVLSLRPQPAFAAAAAKSKKKKLDPPPPPAKAVAPSPAQGPAKADPGGSAPGGSGARRSSPKVAALSTAALLSQATQLYGALEYADVIPLVEAALAQDDVTIDQRLDAYLLHGSALAIVGDAIEAEKPFRFLLRGRPDYEMPAETPPKILAVFRKVQVEERTIVDQMRELARQRAIREIELKAEVPKKVTGGWPLVFEYHLKDPRGAVAAIDLHYRKSASEPFSSLALKVDANGAWTGALPGEWTANEHGFTMQYYVTTKDPQQTDLVRLGDQTLPFAIEVEAGSVADTRAFYTSWWFWSAAGLAVIASGAGGYFYYRNSTSLPETSGRIDLAQ